MISMELIYYLLAIVVLFVFLKIISIPFQIIIKLIINALLGGAILFIINTIGASFGFAIEITWFTSIIAGILGIPGVIIVILMHFLL